MYNFLKEMNDSSDEYSEEEIIVEEKNDIIKGTTGLIKMILNSLLVVCLTLFLFVKLEQGKLLDQYTLPYL